LNIAEGVRQHPDFEAKYLQNSDPHTQKLAFAKILQDVMLKRRLEELELYKLFAKDDSFRTTLSQSIEQTVNQVPAH